MTLPGTAEEALALLEPHAEPGKAEEMLAYHKVPRRYLGVANPVINEMTTEWRRALTLEQRLSLAEALWDTDVHEGRLAAAKLLTQARIRPDAAVWALICRWVPDFDGWAVADHACIAGQKRIMADLTRLDEVEGWTVSDHMWSRRAALVITLPLARLNHPDAAQAAARERVLGWAAGYVADREWFIQKAVGWWLRDLSKHDAERVRVFLAEHGAQMKGFARKEASKYLA